MGTIAQYGPAVELDGTELLAGWQDGRQVSITAGLIASLAQSLVTGGNQARGLATEAIAAGAFLNVYSLGGTLALRNALASDPDRFANASTIRDIAYGVSGMAAFSGLNPLLLIEAAPLLYLSDTVPGGYMLEPPTTQGHIVQSLGPAIPGVGVYFTPQPAVTL